MNWRWEKLERRYFQVVGIFCTIVLSGAIVVTTLIFIFQGDLNPMHQFPTIAFKNYLLGMSLLVVLLCWAISLVVTSRKPKA
jgi:NADH:ubiquinone oxidoreductase subunit 6 (subunit J)